MKTTIYYYTGTGNSLWTARLIAAETGNADIYPMSEAIDATTNNSDAIGLVFPVHIWGIPNPVMRFLNRLENDPGKYYFAFAVNGGQVSRTLIQLKKILAARGMKLSAGFDIVMPSNYIPWGGPGPSERIERLYKAAQDKIKQAADIIRQKKPGPVEKGPLWQRVIFTALYKMSFRQIHTMDKAFWTDEKCNGCGTCEKVCPAGNIEMMDDKPAWLHHCEQCLACIQWCPREAIQYGKKTPGYERYHHPEVKLKDIIDRR